MGIEKMERRVKVRNMQGTMEKPVNLNDELTVHIESTGKKGDGVAVVQGFAIFIPGASLGQEVKIRITRVFEKFAFAQVIG